MKTRKQKLKIELKKIMKDLAKDTKGVRKFIGGKVYDASVIVDKIVGKVEPKSTEKFIIGEGDAHEVYMTNITRGERFLLEKLK